MTAVLPGDRPADRPAVRPASAAAPAVRDFGVRLIAPTAAVHAAVETCRVDCAIHDAARALDDFARRLAAGDAPPEAWPARFADETRRLRDIHAARLADGPDRDRFDAAFDLFAAARAVETRGIAAERHVARVRVGLERALAGYAGMAAAAISPVVADFAREEGEAAIRRQVAAAALTPDEGQVLSRRFRADLARRQAGRMIREAPEEAAGALADDGGRFADLPAAERRRLAAAARHDALARTVDAARAAARDAGQAATARMIRRDVFQRGLAERVEAGVASLSEIAAAARDGILDTAEAATDARRLDAALADRRAAAGRVAKLLTEPGVFLDPTDAADRRDAEIHWRDTVAPLVRGLPPGARAAAEDAVVMATGIAPQPAVDGLRAGLLSADPETRVAAARRLRGWAAARPPVVPDLPVAERGLADALLPYLDLPLADARKVALAEAAAGAVPTPPAGDGSGAPPPTATSAPPRPRGRQKGDRG